MSQMLPHSLHIEDAASVASEQFFEPILFHEKERLLNFFGRKIEVPPLPVGVTPELVREWREKRFELQYWPRVRMAEDQDCPGWVHRPGLGRARENGIRFFQEVQKIENAPENKQNKNLTGLNPLDLPGAWVLRDTRRKPHEIGSNQGLNVESYEDDEFFEEVMRRPRNRIPPKAYAKPGFWSPLLAALKLDSIPGVVMRLPRLIEASVMGQGPDFHGTGTSEWCEEYYEHRERLYCGSSFGGGASFVYKYDDPKISIGCRPLVVFP